MDCGPLCFSESGPTDSHCGLKLYCTVLYGTSTVPYYGTVWYLWYSRAKSGAADSDCGVKLGAENSLSGLKHSVISSKTTVLRTCTSGRSSGRSTTNTLPVIVLLPNKFSSTR